jgi:hypothetical protein
MTVCRTAVEPFFSVSWRSGLPEGEGFWNRSGNVVHFFNSLLDRKANRENSLESSLPSYLNGCLNRAAALAGQYIDRAVAADPAAEV